MTFEVLFRGKQRLRGFEYDLGEWSHDYPRGLEVQLLLADGTATTVLKDNEFEGLRLFLPDNTEVPILFPPSDVSGVRLVQTGTHPVVDWSIAELRFYSER
jgi:hypothetical protein